jgi:hypothetical protein
MQTTDWSKSVRVEVRGDDVVGHAGNVIPRMLVDNLGLTGGLCARCDQTQTTARGRTRRIHPSTTSPPLPRFLVQRAPRAASATRNTSSGS